MSEIKNFFESMSENINEFDFWRYREIISKKSDDYEV